ncbi:hypothetical protein EB796_009250 [Bugula neritina]|uniref:Uncharacterized protein n=1 Tax=Bugula neritina TaxID=10212 RepID=A0A7J7K4D2_BUGNE|nr:hypothetical protein EB796_009250 [Bugula neritina]
MPALDISTNNSEHSSSCKLGLSVSILDKLGHLTQLMLRKMAESNPKLFSLRVHQSTQNENEIMVSEQSSFQTGDIVEIYKDLNSQSSSHVLLTVTVSDEMIKGTDSVSIVDTICNNKHFNFKTFNQVYVKKVVPEPVDLIVLTCKDTYLSRSDMWRMKQHLENKCIYIDKRVTFIDIIMQITVSEIWLKGESLACGYISNKTRICFRSSSSVLHIFLQMSVENVGVRQLR